MAAFPRRERPSAMSQPSAESRYARLLTIAGSDSGGGAGIQADLKTFAALGCYGMSAITALTAQNTIGVRAIHAAPPEFLDQQIDAVVEDIGVDAVKIGMLHSPEIVRTVAAAIERHRLANVVFDPVMVATSGARLIDEPAVEMLVKELFPRTSLVTPNLDEAALLVGFAIHDDGTLQRAAERLIARGARAVLLKGGHLPGEEVVDLLLTADGRREIWRASRIASRNLHGTGCTLSSAIAARLALGDDLVAAIGAARDYVRKAIESGAEVRTGRGHGPLDHGFAPRPTRKLSNQG
jgi:hydroxymethylpyrimidine/phosphomethylpyrimidine kinase